MKKSFVIVLFVLFFGHTLNAQDYKTSLGLRAGYPYGLTVKHFLNSHNAVEGMLASNYGGFVATILLENEHWTGIYPGFNWYWGLGAHIGFWDSGANRYIGSYTGAVLGIDGILGLEYTFDEIPLNLSVDIIPGINILGSRGWGGPNGALSIRYVF